MKTINLKLMGLIGFVAIMIISCSAPVHVEKDKTVDFSKYRTFTWADKNEQVNDHNRANDMMERKFRDAVEHNLYKQGWRMDNRNPDVLISYDLLVERGNRRESEPVYSYPFARSFYNPYYRRFFTVYYPSQFVGYNNYVVPVKKGTVTITVTDAQTEKTVWQGWTTGEINSHNITTKEINSAVSSIFKKFNSDVARL